MSSRNAAAAVTVILVLYGYWFVGLVLEVVGGKNDIPGTTLTSRTSFGSLTPSSFTPDPDGGSLDGGGMSGGGGSNSSSSSGGHPSTSSHETITNPQERDSGAAVLSCNRISNYINVIYCFLFE